MHQRRHISHGLEEISTADQLEANTTVGYLENMPEAAGNRVPAAASDIHQEPNSMEQATGRITNTMQTTPTMSLTSPITEVSPFLSWTNENSIYSAESVVSSTNQTEGYNECHGNEDLPFECIELRIPSQGTSTPVESRDSIEPPRYDDLPCEHFEVRIFPHVASTPVQTRAPSNPPAYEELPYRHIETSTPPPTYDSL